MIVEQLTKTNRKGSYMRQKSLRIAAIAIVVVALVGTVAAQDKPNILVIMGDDIGYWNLSFNNDGMMGYKTPNIDRIAAEGTRLPTTTPSSRAPPAGPRLSPARCLSARV